MHAHNILQVEFGESVAKRAGVLLLKRQRNGVRSHPICRQREVYYSRCAQRARQQQVDLIEPRESALRTGGRYLVLLARDAKIEDPTITEQIERR